MIPHNEVRQITIPLSYDNSKLLARLIDHYSWANMADGIRRIILNNHTTSDNFIIRGKYKNTTEKLELFYFNVVDNGSYFNVNKDFRIEGNLRMLKSGDWLSYLVQVFIQFDIDFMNEYVQDASELVCKRFRKSPNCPNELKVFMKMKYPSM